MITETLLIVLICSIIWDDTETDNQKYANTWYDTKIEARKNDKSKEVSKLYINSTHIKKAGRNQADDIKEGKWKRIVLAVFIMIVVILCMFGFGIISIMRSCKTVDNSDLKSTSAIEENTT